MRKVLLFYLDLKCVQQKQNAIDTPIGRSQFVFNNGNFLFRVQVFKKKLKQNLKDCMQSLVNRAAGGSAGP